MFTFASVMVLINVKKKQMVKLKQESIMQKLDLEELKKLQNEKRAKERRQDNKQHATKIDQGLRQIDSQTGPARAIWELCQNARDLSEDCHIRIELTDNLFKFSHNGKPFDMDSLSSLIKQVSGQYKENDDTVGQYGTGFLTTHYYGMSFKLYGSYQIGENMFIDLNGFEIDRSHESIDELIGKLTDQLMETDKLLNDSYSSEQQEWTVFEYNLPANHRQGASEGVKAAILQMPYVMLFNDRITECVVDDYINNVHVTFRKSQRPDEKGLKKMRIDIIRNGVEEPMDIFYLESVDGAERIALPLETATKTRNIDSISKLFMHFPLLGTEDFGFNFVFHSHNFKPVEKRDGLYLPDGNDNNKKEVGQNLDVLSRMQKILFGWLEEHITEIENSQTIAKLYFNPGKYENSHKEQYINGLRNTWASFYAKLPMIPTDKGLMTVTESELYLLDKEIVNCISSEENISFLSTVRYYAQLDEKYTLPIEKECLAWSDIVYNWGTLDVEPFISVEDIVDNVKEDLDELHNFLLFLKACNYNSLFTQKALIPNREGILHKANELREASEITPDLYEIIRPIIKSDTDRFVNEKYHDIYDYVVYSREDLRDDIKKAIDNLHESISNSDGINSFLNMNDELAIINYCSAFSISNGNNVRNRLMPIICHYEGVEYHEMVIHKLSENEVDIYDNAFRFLVEYELYKLSCNEVEWVKNNLNLYKDFLEEVTSVSSFKKQIGQYSIFPNHYCSLCLADDIKKNTIDEDKCEDLLRIYEQEIGDDLREGLVHKEFEEYWEFDELNAEDICKEIEEKLADDDYSSKTTIEIIEKIDSDEESWGKLFKNIRDNKQNIFFKNAVSGNKKNDVYRLMKNDEYTLATLADLAEHNNLPDILNRAQKLIEQERQERANFEVMYSIGKHIEDMIRSEITEELSDKLQVRTASSYEDNIVVDDIQNGQDIIISYNNQDVFYIEVKSKRNFLSPAYMSKNQIKMACKNADKYALCCVDLSSAQCEDIDNPKIDEIIPHTIFKNDIGSLLLPLVTSVLKADEDFEDKEIKLNGDYSASIPKKIFTEGLNMNEMIEVIVKAIQQ